MVKKQYQVTLDEEIVIKAKELHKENSPLKFETKLSPILNELLLRWVEKEMKQKEEKK
jgi:hypothetical protein